ncbi:hypothetical protein [Bradyrhizobium sp. BR13661]|uniref:hypothetical protein n=1 Tax=Bradyrhizobium sp. BR13661 TaxID=2940622 RepID=UPI00247357A6|nr:hypothetical protein [Bradyrhizobium sp. BR13661]MDH6260785.1 hypothetical protein [Bradyrhizobium sp. BR13661]
MTEAAKVDCISGEADLVQIVHPGQSWRQIECLGAWRAEGMQHQDWIPSLVRGFLADKMDGDVRISTWRGRIDALGSKCRPRKHHKKDNRQKSRQAAHG